MIDWSRYEQIEPAYTLLKKKREELGLKQRETAERAGVSLRHYQRFESGERDIEHAEFRYAYPVMKVLGIDPDYFCKPPRYPKTFTEVVCAVLNYHDEEIIQAVDETDDQKRIDGLLELSQEISNLLSRIQHDEIDWQALTVPDALLIAKALSSYPYKENHPQEIAALENLLNPFIQPITGHRE